MVQVSYPGVYIQEIPSGVRTITGVATSVTAFVGYTRKGLLDKAVSLTSYSDFERQYGGLDRASAVSYAVRQFFANGGVMRVASGTRAAAWTLADDAAAPVLAATAFSPGAWANALRIEVQRTGVRNPDAEFNLVVYELAGSTLATLETHRNLSLDSGSANYAPAVVSNDSTRVTLARESGLVFTDSGFALSGAVPANLAIAGAVIAGTVIDNFGGAYRSQAFSLAVAGSPWATAGDLAAAVNAAIAAQGLSASLAGSTADATGGPGTDHLKLSAVEAGESSALVISAGAAGSLVAAIQLGLANGGREIPGAAQHRPAAAGAPLAPYDLSPLPPTTTGLDGSPASASELAGSPSLKSGIQALRDVDLFNLLVIPETFAMTAGQEAGLIPDAISLCDERRAFYIIDPPSNLTLSTVGTWTHNPKSRNAAIYWPPVRIADPLDGLRLRSMPPSGTIAGLYSRTDSTRGVWKAPAGTDATLNGVVELAVTVTDPENGLLNPLGVNVLRSFPAYGRVAWGARTTKGADAQADEYKYIPIRRLALFIEESLYRGTQWVVFEPNDEPMWAQVRLNLGAFMNGLFRQGAFQGKTPQEAYFVKCDKETTTQADRNLGIVNIIVGFAPLKPAEFVVISIQQIAGDLQ